MNACALAALRRRGARSTSPARASGFRRVGVGQRGFLVAALSGLAGIAITHAQPAAARTGAGSIGPVVYGYPYAGRCPVAGIADVVDRWKMDECNCTSYVAWALDANDQREDWFIPGAMDAWNWPHVAGLAGLKVGTKPRVGAVAVWENVTHFGHVAYVTAVEPDGRFDVAEYNSPAKRAVSPFQFDERAGLPRAGVVFIYVSRRGTSRPASADEALERR